jgi:hypothetical protein
MQDRYMPLSPQIKRASTAEIRQIAHSCADYMLSHTDEIGGLQNLGDESLIREALLRAIPTDA